MDLIYEAEMKVYEKILDIISTFSESNISESRKQMLKPLRNLILDRVRNGADISLNFICTHNSRRSQFAQIWAQTLSYYFGIQNVFCYSGSTISSSVYPQIVETLVNQGFEIKTLSTGENPVYELKYSQYASPLVCFSKNYNDDFNPKSGFIAVMTCDHADGNCPYVDGAEIKLLIEYEDPKCFDQTNLENEKYRNKSIEIAQEMWWVLNLKNK